MDLRPLQDALEKTLSNSDLSRGERRALTGILDDARLEPRELAVLRSRAFDLARERLDRTADRQVIDWLEGIVKLLAREEPGSSAPRPEAYFSPSMACPRKILGLLDGARDSAEICVYTITDNRIANAIVDAHRRGVRVRVVTDNDKSADLGSDVSRLEDAGVPVARDETDKHMHHKFAVFDRRVVMTGSYNWTRSAATQNEENLVVLADPGLVKAFLAEFEGLWKKFHRG